MARREFQKLLGRSSNVNAALVLAGLLIAASVVETPEMISTLIVLSCYYWLSKPSSKMLRSAIVSTMQSSKILILSIVVICSVAIACDFVCFAVGLASAIVNLFLYKVGFAQTHTTGQGHRQKCGKMKAEWFGHSKKRRSQNAPSVVLSRTISGEPLPDHMHSTAAQFKHVTAPVAELTKFEASVQMLVQRHTPEKKDYVFADKLAEMVKRRIEPVVPEAEIIGVPNGNMKVMGEEKMEIDIVVTVDSETLAARLKAWAMAASSKRRSPKDWESMIQNGLQKAATRALSKRLDFTRFWRCQIGGYECLMSFYVDPVEGFSNYPALLNFTVNAVYPLRLLTLLLDDSLACKELSLLVMSWANERSITNISRGQPHKYAWALLARHFFQRHVAGKFWPEPTERITQLFKEFVAFYGNRFEKPLLVCFTGHGAQACAQKAALGLPYIEDLHEPGVDVFPFASVDGVERVTEELTRARNLLARGCAFAELMEKWRPPQGYDNNRHFGNRVSRAKKAV